jgi:hypothetical protein
MSIDDENFVEKIEMCLCKKDVYFNPNDKVKMIYEDTFNCKNSKAFEKGKYYKYFIEDADSMWVYYNEDGDIGEQGYRFHSDRNDYGVERSFKEHFIYGRLLKLKELEKINYE